MLIDQYLSQYDVTEAQEVQVNAKPEVTYLVIRETDLRDPTISALFSIQELPAGLTRRLAGEPSHRDAEAVTFTALANSEMRWVPLDENVGIEFVIGAVGRFWHSKYRWHPVARDQFVAFNDPGYAKLIVSFRVQPTTDGQSLLHYEARTATTDETARMRFRSYWRVVHPGVTIVMRRVLQRIRVEAEQRQIALGGLSGAKAPW